MRISPHHLSTRFHTTDHARHIYKVEVEGYEITRVKGPFKRNPLMAVLATTTDGGRWDTVPSLSINRGKEFNASSKNTHPLLALRSRHQRTDTGALGSWHHVAMLWKPPISSYYRQEKASRIADGCHRAAQHQYPRGCTEHRLARQPAFFSYCERQIFTHVQHGR